MYLQKSFSYIKDLGIKVKIANTIQISIPSHTGKHVISRNHYWWKLTHHDGDRGQVRFLCGQL